MLAYGEELELIKDNVKVIWENIGEGRCGDYNEADEEDENFLRFRAFVKQDNDWEEVDDSSHCTYVAADTDTNTLNKLLNILLAEFYNILHDNPEASVKKLSERLSWIDEEWLKK